MGGKHLRHRRGGLLLLEPQLRVIPDRPPERDDDVAMTINRVTRPALHFAPIHTPLPFTQDGVASITDVTVRSQECAAVMGDALHLFNLSKSPQSYRKPPEYGATYEIPTPFERTVRCTCYVLATYSSVPYSKCNRRHDRSETTTLLGYSTVPGGCRRCQSVRVWYAVAAAMMPFSSNGLPMN